MFRRQIEVQLYKPEPLHSLCPTIPTRNLRSTFRFQNPNLVNDHRRRRQIMTIDQQFTMMQIFNVTIKRFLKTVTCRRYTSLRSYLFHINPNVFGGWITRCRANRKTAHSPLNVDDVARPDMTRLNRMAGDTLRLFSSLVEIGDDPAKHCQDGDRQTGENLIINHPFPDGVHRGDCIAAPCRRKGEPNAPVLPLAGVKPPNPTRPAPAEPNRR